MPQPWSVVSCDGGEFSSQYGPPNLLVDNNSAVYSTAQGKREDVTIVIKHELGPFLIDAVTLAVPDKGFNSPVALAVLFSSWEDPVPSSIPPVWNTVTCQEEFQHQVDLYHARSLQAMYDLQQPRITAPQDRKQAWRRWRGRSVLITQVLLQAIELGKGWTPVSLSLDRLFCGSLGFAGVLVAASAHSKRTPAMTSHSPCTLSSVTSFDEDTASSCSSSPPVISPTSSMSGVCPASSPWSVPRQAGAAQPHLQLLLKPTGEQPWGCPASYALQPSLCSMQHSGGAAPVVCWQAGLPALAQGDLCRSSMQPGLPKLPPRQAAWHAAPPSEPTPVCFLDLSQRNRVQHRLGAPVGGRFLMLKLLQSRNRQGDNLDVSYLGLHTMQMPFAAGSVAIA